ncbi:hypothetical protein DJ480_07630 [Pseudomonas sp. Leaf98]|nr:hypothetical protein DJ480_07630 [Pseudomonas sp. Leaf98]
MFNQQSRARAPPNPPSKWAGCVIVPTLCVGMPHWTLCVRFWDAERPWLHSHAERENDQLCISCLCYLFRASGRRPWSGHRRGGTS